MVNHDTQDKSLPNQILSCDQINQKHLRFISSYNSKKAGLEGLYHSTIDEQCRSSNIGICL